MADVTATRRDSAEAAPVASDEPKVPKSVSYLDIFGSVGDAIFKTAPRYGLRGAEAGIRAGVYGVGTAIQKGSVEAGIKAGKEQAVKTMKGEEGISKFAEKPVAAFGRGFTGGFVSPETEPTDIAEGLPEYLKQPVELTEGLFVAGAEALGTVARYYGIGKVLRGGVGKIPAIKELPRRFPLLSRYIGPVIESAAAFGVGGQFERQALETPDLQDKYNLLQDDVRTGALFGLVSSAFGVTRGVTGAALRRSPETAKIVNAVVEYPTMFTLGYKMAAEGNPDSTTKDRVTSGLVLAGLHKILGYPDRPIDVREGPKMKPPTREEVGLLFEKLTAQSKAIGKRVGERPGEVELPRLESPKMSTEEAGIAGDLPALVENVGKSMEKYADNLGAPKQEPRDISFGKYLRPSGMIALRFQNKYKIPTFDTYRGVEDAVSAIDDLVNSASRVGQYIMKDVGLSVTDRANVGDLGIKLEELDISPMSAKGRKVAAEMGLGEKELTAVSQFQKLGDTALYPLAKAIDPTLEKRENYWIFIRKGKPNDPATKFYDEVPLDVAFNVKNRGEFIGEERINDPVVLLQLYTRQIARKAFMQPHVDKYNEYKELLPPNVRGRMDEFINSNMGRIDRSGGIWGTFARNLDLSLNNIYKKFTGEEGKFNLGGNIDSLSSIFYSSIYGGALGFQNLKAPFMNYTQAPLYLIPEAGPKILPFLTKAQVQMLSPKKVRMVIDRGWVRDVQSPADQVMRDYRYSQAGLLEKTSIEITDANNLALTLFKNADLNARVTSALAASGQFQASLKTFRAKGFDAFAEEMGLTRRFPEGLKGKTGKVVKYLIGRGYYSETELAELRRHMEDGNMVNAEDAYVRSRVRWSQMSQLAGEFPSNNLVDFGGKSVYSLRTFGLGAANVFWNRWSPLQKAMFAGMSYVLVQAGRQAGIELGHQLGPVAVALPGIEGRGVAFDMAFSISQAISSMITDQRLSDDDLAELERSFRIFGIPENRIQQFLLSGANDWMWYDFEGRPIEQSTWQNAAFRVAGFKPIQDTIYYESKKAETKLEQEDARKRDQLKDLIRAGDDAKIMQYIDENPEFMPLLLDQSWISGVVLPSNLEPLSGVVRRLWPQFVEEVEKVRSKFPARYR